jgi:NAD(P)-dependent dehydrogenase (short-subunit alcohol dehydrogenase family)|tara:strand:- start:29994 stop:30815 length:822 start_codon:yes stop_codon:yes gene_type:complete
MSGRLHGRSIVVTGAGSGIGSAIARHLAVNEGANVVITGRRAEPLEQLADETGCVVCTGDMTRREDVRKVLGTAVNEFGGLDALVSNHGLLTLADFKSTNEQVWRDMLDTNTIAPFVLTQEAAPLMEQGGGGAVIFVASVAAYFAYAPDNAAYSSSKGAVITMTRSLAVELGRANIRVNCICPGLVRTPMVDPIFQQVADARGVSLDEAYAICGAELPAGRIGLPGDFGAPVAFLASDESRWITGAVLNVDGGTTALNPGIMSVVAQMNPTGQ